MRTRDLWKVMFCACIGILICLSIIITGAAISSIDVVRYDFGLYYILIAIVAMMGSLTLCVIRPTTFCGVSDPRWYTNFCERIHRALVNAHEKRLAAQLLELELAEGGSMISANTITATSSRKPGGILHQRATLMMLGPAVELMHHVIHGVAENKEDEDTEATSSLPSEVDKPTLWWDTFQQPSDQQPKLARPKKKRKRRPRLEKREYDLYTITSISSDMANLANCSSSNNVTTSNHLTVRPCQRPDENIAIEDGTSEVFL